jgi:glycosyltransferase involved in cell wall biosynthesis
VVSRPPRIVYYTYPSFLDLSLSLVRELARRAEVHLFLELNPGAWGAGLFDVPPRPLPAGITPADPVIRDCFPAGVRAYWQDCASFHLVIHEPFRRLSTGRVSRAAGRRIHRLRPDVVHLDDASFRVVWGLRELGTVPLVLTVHDPEAHSGEASIRKRLAHGLAFRRTRRFQLHNRTMLAPFCARHRVPPARVDVVPLGVTEIYREWVAAPVAEEERTVLFFGRLSPYKGLEVLYAAARLVAERVPGLRLVVAGRAEGAYVPPPPPVLANGGHVEVLERYIHNAEIAQLFSRAALVVCPYNDATQSAVVLVAYAFGKPVVATRVGGLPEYVADGSTGCLVPPRDPAALAAAIVALLQDPAARQALGANIRRRAATDLSWPAIAAQTLAGYRRAIEGGA